MATSYRVPMAVRGAIAILGFIIGGAAGEGIAIALDLPDGGEGVLIVLGMLAGYFVSRAILRIIFVRDGSVSEPRP